MGHSRAEMPEPNEAATLLYVPEMKRYCSRAFCIDTMHSPQPSASGSSTVRSTSHDWTDPVGASVVVGVNVYDYAWPPSHR
jgi:hypothetical protein